MTMTREEEYVQSLICELYNVRPSTAREIMSIAKSIAEIADKEYTYGMQDASSDD